MANRWGNSGNNDRLYFAGASKITADGDGSHKIKMLAPWNKSYNKPSEHIKKQRYHFAKKVCLVKDMVFPVVMYECESWTIRIPSTGELIVLNCGVGEDS